MFVPEEAQALLDAWGVLTPDVRVEPHQPEVGFVHRASRDRDAYFLANVGNSTRSFKASFRQSRKHVSIRAPMNGQVPSLNPSESQDRFTPLPVKLAPRSSTFVVFDFALSKFDSTGLPGPSQTKELSPTWLLNFEGADAPPPRLLNELVSWTSWPEAKYYSGRATYTARFQWNDPLPAQTRLILSQLHEVAAFSLNGAPAGEICTPPYEIDVTRLLTAGSNTLSLTVANLPLNRFLGAPEEDLKSLRAAYGNRFPEPPEKRAATPPSPSGLIGPVALRFVP